MEGAVRQVTTSEVTTADRVCLEIPPRPQFVSLCRLALTAICREHRFSDDEIADLKLAITEACSNSIRHAYDDNDGSESRVFVSFEVQADRLVVEVRDHGRGFSYEGANTDDLPEGGLGIAIIRAVVDEFDVLDNGDQPGAALRLVKVRQAAEDAA